MWGGQKVRPLWGQVSMGSSRPFASSSRNCCVMGPKLAQMLIMKRAFLRCTSSIMRRPSANSSVRKSIAFHR